METRQETEAVGLLYDAALGHVAWGEVGDCLRALVDGSTLTFTAQYALDGPVDMLTMLGITSREAELYGAHYYEDDPWRVAALERRIFDRAVLGTDLVSDLDLQQSRIYCELIRPNTDVFHGVMALGSLPEASPADGGLSGGVYALGIHRPRRASPFARAATETLQRLLPHIGRALQVRARLDIGQQAVTGAAAALDGLSFGVVQLSATGRLVSANRAALDMMTADDGLLLTAGVVHALSAGDDERLQRAIVRAARTTRGEATGGNMEGCAGDHLHIARPSGRRAYTAVVTPLGLDRQALLPHQPAVILIVTDPEAGPRIDARALTAVFGLTPAEARLVSLLATGLPLPAVARHLGVSFETARKQVATARAKTGTASQVDLVRLVLTALAPVV